MIANRVRKWTGQRRTVAAAFSIVVITVAVAAFGAGAGDSQEPGPAMAQRAAAPTTAAPPPALTEASDPPHLLPNLRSQPPEAVSIRLVDGIRQLRFSSIIGNTGIGPVETDPDALLPCSVGQRHASQVIYLDSNGNGRYDRSADVITTRRPAGCMVFHPTHDHWHFDAAAHYWLTGPSSDIPVVDFKKVSFCWRDNRVVPTDAEIRPTKFYGDCERDTVQGITPGWADVYSARLPDQHLDLPPGLADGVYCLHNEADPLELLLESVEDDNAAVLPIRLTGTSVEVAPPGACDAPAAS